jgi:hypothetical protein
LKSRQQNFLQNAVHRGAPRLETILMGTLKNSCFSRPVRI